MLAEFRVIPVGGSQPFVRLIADLLPILAETNLQYQVHAMGTTVEGDLDAILELVRRCHAELRKHADRVLIELSLDDRQGAEGARWRAASSTCAGSAAGRWSDSRGRLRASAIQGRALVLPAAHHTAAGESARALRHHRGLTLVSVALVVDDHPVARRAECMGAGGVRVEHGEGPALALEVEHR